MSGFNEQSSGDFTAWSIGQLEAHAATLALGQIALDTIRVLAQSHAYEPSDDQYTRRRWAKLSLYANERFHSEGPWDRARMLSHNFMLRTWMIEHLGPDDGDADWDPDALAADTLAVLTLEPYQASAVAAGWPALPIEQIGELRRNKNLTAHLDLLIGHLPAGPVKEQLIAWREVREHLP